MVQSLNLLLGLVALFFLIAGFIRSVDPSSYTHYRLPTAIKPNHYHLKIITHLNNPANLTFNGEVSIDLQILDNTKNITLHAKNLTIDESHIQLYNSDESEIHSCLEGIDIVPEMDYYIIRLCEHLLKGQAYKVKLHFSSALNEHFLYGYYRTSYTDDGTNETRWLSMTKFEPTYARLAFPCFDEPNYKANFTIWLGHHKNLTGISNMAMETQIPLDGLDNFVWSIFEESVPMPTYLVAYTVNDFVYKEAHVEGSDVVFRTWCRQDIIDECAYAAEAGPKVLAYYERIFGIQFPLKKIDQIAVPAMISPAMENWGLIAYIEMFLQFTPNDSSPPTRSYTDKVISHELAHQWFGNLVTMKWWSDLWLNEGFATYLASFGVKYLHPEYEGYDPEVADYMFTLLERDAQLDSHPLSRPVCNTSEIRRSFNGISYRKGSAILGMLHRFLGYDEFFEAVRDYLEKHKYSNAEQDDLWAAFERTAERNNLLDPRYDIKTIMDSWTLQTGFPLVKVNRNHESGSIEITQERFLENATLSIEMGKKCWWTPLTYTTAAEKDFTTKTPKTWLECDEYGKSIPLKVDNVTGASDWIVFNIQLSGIYRVTYDRKSWQLIAEALKSENFGNICVLNRCQLISDVLALAWNGYDNYESVFNILEYLAKEHEYKPWELAYYDLIGVSYILEYFPQTYAYLKAFVGYIIEPEYLRLGGINDTDATNMTSPQINHKDQIDRWACRVDLKDCVQEAINYFQQWKHSENPKEENPIPESLRSTVYCTTIRHGNIEDWSFLWQRYEESNEYILLDSLACSRNQSVLKDYLHLIFDNATGISNDDAMSAFHAIANSKVGLSLVREYFAEHANRLCKDFDVDRLIDALHNIFSNEELQKFVNVLDANKECAQSSTQILPDHLERIHLNIKWVERNLKDVKLQLEKRLSAMGIVVEIDEDQ